MLRSRVLRGVYTLVRVQVGDSVADKYASIFFFLHPIYYPCTTLLALPPSSNLDPGSHSGPSSPLPLRYVPPFLMAGIIRLFFSPRRLASNRTYPRC